MNGVTVGQEACGGCSDSLEVKEKKYRTSTIGEVPCHRKLCVLDQTRSDFLKHVLLVELNCFMVTQQCMDINYLANGALYT